jgi:hypothetical protein
LTKWLEASQEASLQAGERGIRARTADVDGPGVVVMFISLEKVAEKYLTAKKLSAGTQKEYRSSITNLTSMALVVDACYLES